MNTPRICLVICVAALAGWGSAQELTQIKQDFTEDPGWDNSNNRVEASNPPTVTQDFGWTPGTIGGEIWKSTTPAWYAMPLQKPLSFKDAFSASGRIAIMPESSRGVAYLGFFNHERQGWRPWNSMAMRIVHEGKRAVVYVDYMTALWNAGAAEMELTLPADGSEHQWQLTYDPDATRAPWADTKLQSYLTTGRQQVPEILAKAHAAGETSLTREQLEARLRKALELGLVSYLPRHNTEYWLLKQVNEDLKGMVAVRIDDGPEFRTYLSAAMRETPVQLDRFGIFNFQMYHGMMKFFVSDLTVNGTKVDLATDPGWQGNGNRARFPERDFQRQDFGYSPNTNHAGGQRGEIGGQFYNVEPIDPHHGYYADDIGVLTLDDPLQFSGRISFMEGSTDAGMFFGYFNSADEKKELAPNVPNSGGLAWPQPNTLGIVVDGPARIGWWFIPFCTAATRELSAHKDGPVFLPLRKPRTFEVKYDPKANNGVGRITVTLDGEAPFTLDLTPEQRKAGAKFDRFGLMSFRRGGKYSTLFFDDLSYTARRPAGYVPVRREQKTVTVPYPPGGRQH